MDEYLKNTRGFPTRKCSPIQGQITIVSSWYEYVSQLNRLQPVQGQQGQIQQVDDAVAVDVAGEDAIKRGLVRSHVQIS